MRPDPQRSIEATRMREAAGAVGLVDAKQAFNPERTSPAVRLQWNLGGGVRLGVPRVAHDGFVPPSGVIVQPTPAEAPDDHEGMVSICPGHELERAGVMALMKLY